MAVLAIEREREIERENNIAAAVLSPVLEVGTFANTRNSPFLAQTPRTNWIT